MWRRYLLAASVLLAVVAGAGLVGTWTLRDTALERVMLPPGRAMIYAALLGGLRLSSLGCATS